MGACLTTALFATIELDRFVANLLKYIMFFVFCFFFRGGGLGVFLEIINVLI